MPQPVSDRGGWRVDTNLPGERCRYVFARPCDGLCELAREITAPDVLLKLGGAEAEMRACVTDRWELQTSSKMMLSHNDAIPGHNLPKGYRAHLSREGDVALVQIFAEDGSLAASGRAAEFAGVYCYDQIATEPTHQRKGLGRVVMAKLLEARRSPASQQILTATHDGHALYTALGWETVSGWMTAQIPA